MIPHLVPELWETLLLGISDQGEIAASPCRLVLPFHYPATIEGLDDDEQDHFSFPESAWELHCNIECICGLQQCPSQAVTGSRCARLGHTPGLPASASVSLPVTGY